MRLIDFVNKYPGKPWDWTELTCNKSITFDDVLSNPDKPWKWRLMHWNPNITVKIILEHRDKPWNCLFDLHFDDAITWLGQGTSFSDIRDKIISLNTHITIENILKYPKKYDSWSDSISLNPNVTFQDVLKYPKKHWDWQLLSWNPNITFQDIEDNLDKPWDWGRLSTNDFTGPFYVFENHKKQLVREFLETCQEELISRTCTPDRILQWNEQFCTDYSDLYLSECSKWKNT